MEDSKIKKRPHSSETADLHLAHMYSTKERKNLHLFFEKHWVPILVLLCVFLYAWISIHRDDFDDAYAKGSQLAQFFPKTNQSESSSAPGFKLPDATESGENSFDSKSQSVSLSLSNSTTVSDSKLDSMNNQTVAVGTGELNSKGEKEK